MHRDMSWKQLQNFHSKSLWNLSILYGMVEYIRSYLGKFPISSEKFPTFPQKLQMHFAMVQIKRGFQLFLILWHKHISHYAKIIEDCFLNRDNIPSKVCPQMKFISNPRYTMNIVV